MSIRRFEDLLLLAEHPALQRDNRLETGLRVYDASSAKTGLEAAVDEIPQARGQAHADEEKTGLLSAAGQEDDVAPSPAVVVVPSPAPAAAPFVTFTHVTARWTDANVLSDVSLHVEKGEAKGGGEKIECFVFPSFLPTCRPADCDCRLCWLGQELAADGGPGRAAA